MTSRAPEGANKIIDFDDYQDDEEESNADPKNAKTFFLCLQIHQSWKSATRIYVPGENTDNNLWGIVIELVLVTLGMGGRVWRKDHSKTLVGDKDMR